MSGICGAGMRRAADALLKALGQEAVTLVLPGMATGNDAAGQLGLVDPGVQEVVVSPVVMRRLNTGNTGPRRRLEFTLPASAIANALPALGMGTGEDLFKAVIGLMFDGDLFHIESVEPESFGGTVCLYLVTAVE